MTLKVGMRYCGKTVRDRAYVATDN